MNILCNICSEYLNNEEDLVVTLCGHCFHKNCVSDWLKNSQTCPSCRHTCQLSSLIKVFVENDQSKLNDLHAELLKSNEMLTKELDELKEKTRKQECELVELTGKYNNAKDKLKTLQREKQMDDMAIAGLKMIKEDSTKEIVKLSSLLNTLKLDLLAEKQLRRVHQTTLHQLDPENENYDPKSLTVDEQCEKQPINYTITPFWQLSTEAKKDVDKKDFPYIIPSKIQKSSVSKFGSSNSLLRQKRSSSRDEIAPDSSLRIPFTASSMLSFPAPQDNRNNPANSDSNNTVESVPKSFNFTNPSSTTSLFRFGSTSSDTSSSTRTSSDELLIFKRYRNPYTIDSPRASDR